MWAGLFSLALIVQAAICKPLQQSGKTFRADDGNIQVQLKFLIPDESPSMNKVRGVASSLGQTIGSAINLSKDLTGKTVGTADKGIHKGFGALESASSSALHLPFKVGGALKNQAGSFSQQFGQGYSKSQEGRPEGQEGSGPEGQEGSEPESQAENQEENQQE